MYSRSFTDDNCTLQLIKERGARLNFVLSNKELVGNAKPKGRLGCNDHETVEAETLVTTRRERSKMTMPNFRRAEFGLLEDLLSRTPWDRALSIEGWTTSKDCFLKAQDQCIPTKRKLEKNVRRSVWMNKEVLDKFKRQTGSLQSMETGEGSLGIGQRNCPIQTARKMKLLLLWLLLLV